jgi:3-methyl-2-oxobutanoate hydroxymethyltransferase
MNTRSWIRAKKNRKRWAMLTAYDAPTAQIQQECGVDILLVGDSLGMVVLGYPSTLPVTMDEMLHHAKAVRRGAPKAFIIGDMPYKAVSKGVACAVREAKRFKKEAKCDAVKVEWRHDAIAITKAVIQAGVPVMGHIGLSPQDAAKKRRGFKVQARAAKEAAQVLAQALELERAGAFGVLMELVPKNVAQTVTRSLKIPTFGIGAGRYCDGQVLVYQDLIGLFQKFHPKHVKSYDDFYGRSKRAVARYVRDVRTGRFPTDDHSFHMKKEEKELFEKALR